MSAVESAVERDLRIDFFRGLALLFIFLDHIPDNIAAKFTMRVFGFSDAAEVFVLLAGFSAVLAYGHQLNEGRGRPGISRVAARIRDIYIYHIVVLLIAIAFLFALTSLVSHDKYLQLMGMAKFASEPIYASAQAGILYLQPNLMNILPLYIVLLAAFPFNYWLLRRDWRVAVMASAAVWWLSGSIGLNLPASTGGGWFLNPLAWQFLFTLGAAAAILTQRGYKLKSRLLFWVCVAYLTYAFVLYACWTQIPGLQNWRLLDLESFGFPDKTNLSAWRLTHILALAYVVAVIVPKDAAWLSSRPAGVITRWGRHALQVFSAGVLGAIIGGTIVYEFGSSVPLLIIANACGLGLMVFAAWWAGERKALKPVTTARPLIDVTRELTSGRPKLRAAGRDR